MDCNKRGFTLVEVMAALTLLGLIAVLLASGTRLSLDVSARGNAKADAIRKEQTERSLMRSQLQGAVPFRYWTEVENRREERIAFEGESDRIRFVSRFGILEGPSSLPRWVDLRLQEVSSGTSKIVVEEHRVLSPNNDASENTAARAEMLDCIEIHFEYLDMTGEKPLWLSSWNGRDRKAPLPFAVRIQCKTNADSTRMLVVLDYAELARQGFVLQ